MRFADICAGLGGFHIGLRRLGYRCVFASELDEELRDVYELNHGLRPEGDIMDIDPATIPETDILCGGIPCQPHSYMGARTGMNDPRATILHKFIDIFEEKLPKYIIFENVPGFRTSDGGRPYAQLCNALYQAGYDTMEWTINPYQYGIPQNRPRMFLISSRDHPLMPFTLPGRMHEKECPPLQNFFDYNPVPNDGLTPEQDASLAAWEELMRLLPDDRTLPNYLYADYLKDTEYIDNRNAPDEALKYLVGNRQLYGNFKDIIDKWRFFWGVDNLMKSHSIFQWSLRGNRHQRLLEQNYIVQFRPSGIRVSDNKICNCLTASTSHAMYLRHLDRNLTVSECARLMDLQELKHFPNNAYKAIGNAVCARIIEKIAESLQKSAQSKIFEES